MFCENIFLLFQNLFFSFCFDFLEFFLHSLSKRTSRVFFVVPKFFLVVLRLSCAFFTSCVFQHLLKFSFALLKFFFVLLEFFLCLFLLVVTYSTFSRIFLYFFYQTRLSAFLFFFHMPLSSSSKIFFYSSIISFRTFLLFLPSSVFRLVFKNFYFVLQEFLCLLRTFFLRSLSASIF